VGSRGDRYDNALAESVTGLYKAEPIHRRGPWRTVDQVELATAAWVDWWNTTRLHEACGDVPPPSSRPPTMSVRSAPSRPPDSNQPSLHETQGGS
jgi:putative transposase